MMIYKKQQGVILVVSLLILLVVTLLGTAAMQSTGLEFRMAKNTQERQQVFQATETALRRIEQDLDDNPYSKTQLDSNNCSSGDTDCFDDTCAGGLCFFGSNIGNQAACEPLSGTINPLPIWSAKRSPVTWDTPTMYRTLTAADLNTDTGNNDISVDYIVEFICFADTLLGTVATDSGDAFYRITALGKSGNERVKVMLQTTYSTPLL